MYDPAFGRVATPSLMLRIRPEAQVAEEPCEGGGLVVGVEAAGVGEDQSTHILTWSLMAGSIVSSKIVAE